jgi:hypothetical protein
VGNYFLQSYRVAANPATTYELTVALGVRDDPSTFGIARLEITVNGFVVTSACYDKAALDALSSTDSSGKFTDASVSWTSDESVTADSLLAIRIVKVGGADTVIDFDHVRFTAESPPQADYHSWISDLGFAIDPSLRGLHDDPDADGLANLVEAWFGTHPRVANPGISSISSNGSISQFSHPRNLSPIADLSGHYEWSPDLTSWHRNGEGPQNGAVIQFGSTVTGGETLVIATSSIPQSRVYFRLVVTAH